MKTNGESLSQEAASPIGGGKRKNLKIIKRPMRLGLWNTRTLYKTGNKTFLVREMEKYNIDACGICETHLTGSNTETIEGWLLVNSGMDDIHRHGVGLLLSPRARASLLSYEAVSERILKARLYTKQANISIIVAYAPTEDAEDDTKDSFYETLQNITDGVQRHDLKLVIGDLNAKVGSNIGPWQRVLGHHGIGDKNNNGLRLLEFCAENDMVVGGTLFQHKTIHKYTWTSPDGNTHNQIDHVLINGKWRKSLLDVRAFRGADIGSDHELVIAKIQLKLAAQGKKTKNPKLMDAELLLLPQLAREYQIKIANRFDALPDLTSKPDVDHEWNSFRDAVYTAAEKTVGYQTSQHKCWISPTTCELIKHRRNAKKVKDQSQTEESKSEYRKLDKKVKNSAEQDWKNWIDRQASALEEAAGRKSQREVYQKVQILTGKKTRNTSVVKDKDGKIIDCKEKKLERWAEHFKELLNVEPPDIALEDITAELDELEIDLSPPTKNEVDRAVGKIKNNKAAGYDKITGEMLKAGGDKLIDWLLRICIAVWTSERMPEDWKRGVIVKIPKKGDIAICANNRGITLLSIAGKVFCTLVLLRIRDAADERLRENQAGFRKGRSCSDQCFALRQLVEKSLEFQIPVKINFIDFKAAFDSIQRDSLWKIVEFYGLPRKLINIMKNTYDGSTCCVKVDGEITDWFEVTTGVRQGCVWSPLLFGIVIDWVLKNSLDKNDLGIVLERRRSSRYQQQRLSDLDFADDIALIDESEQRLQYATCEVEEKGRKVGLTINSKKTKVMDVAKERNDITITLSNQNSLENVDRFVYLGSTITHNGDLTPELDNRIGKAANAFNRLLPVMRHKSIKMRTKIAIYQAVVLTTLLYGSESWNTTVQEEKRLAAFHTRCLRRILGVSWQDHVPNGVIFERTSQVSLINILQHKRLTWLGHVTRMHQTRLPRRLLQWEPQGRRRPGRQRMRWKDAVSRDLQDSEISFDEAIVVAQDRKKWRSFVSALCGLGPRQQ